MKDLTKLTKYRDKKDEAKYFPQGTPDNVGFFEIPLKTGHRAYVTAERTAEWEHVAVSLLRSCPSWEEMCEIKDFFWNEEETVIQFHPKKSEYVNICKTCLHLWRPVNVELPLPPKKLLL